MTNTTIITPVRVTKSMKLSAIIEMLNGKESVTFGAENHSPVVFDKEGAKDFLTSEIAALAKKNSGERKQTEKQIENETFKEMIYNFLKEQEERFIPSDTNKSFVGKTCTEILKGIPEFDNHPTVVFNNQKVSALANQLEKAGRLTKETIKGRNYFRLAVLVNEEEESAEGEEEA